MTIRLPIDVATRVSAELSRLLEKLVNDPDREEPPTLEDVRALLRRRGDGRAREMEFLHPHDTESLLVEVDNLVEEFGGEASLANFVSGQASEGLSRVIEAAMGEPGTSRVPTLGTVRAAMTSGLTVSLIGQGALDEDDESVLLAEIDELIDRHGRDAVAEQFIRFE